MITSTSSSQVKYVVNLQKKSKLRKEEKQFVVEGIKMVSEAPTDRLVKVYQRHLRLIMRNSLKE